MHDRTPWTRGQAGEIKVKNRTYKNLVEFSRQCATCQKPFSIFVTNKIADGEADSNSFGLKNCEEHRRNRPASEVSEVEALKMANNVMKQELAGLYARDKDQFAEIQELKARLASYELQGAMQNVAQNKMPWEQNGT